MSELLVHGFAPGRGDLYAVILDSLGYPLEVVIKTNRKGVSYGDRATSKANNSSESQKNYCRPRGRTVSTLTLECILDTLIKIMIVGGEGKVKRYMLAFSGEM